MKIRTALLAGFGAVVIAGLAAQAQVPGVNSTLNSVFTLAYDQSTMKPTYSASSIFAPAASATDICYLTGSATKTIKVRRIIFAGVASAVQADPIAIIKRSTATVGAGANMLPVAYDSTNSLTNSTTNTASATADLYTANPTTLGTYVGTLADLYVNWGNLTTGLGSTTTFEFGARGSPIVLRGAAQQVAVNLGGSTYTTPVTSCTFEWTEE